jgi:hypothetical protein
MQSKVLQLAENLVEHLKDENRLVAIDALDVARILMRKQATDAQENA